MQINFKRTVNVRRYWINLSNKKMENLNLSPKIKSVLLGTLLGDGSLNIQNNYKNARFQMRHGNVQKEYFDWKVKILKELATEKSVHFQKPYQKEHSTGKWHFQTRALPTLTQLYEIVCSSNKHNKIKQVKRSWLNHLTRESLMVLWLDDGSLLKKKGILCTEGFSKKENLILSKYLKQVWKIDSKVVKQKKAPLPVEVGQEKKKYYRIRINATNLTKFFKLIIRYIPCGSLVYKVCIDYVEPELKQRWISILKQQLPQFSQEIDKVYANRLFKKSAVNK